MARPLESCKRIRALAFAAIVIVYLFASSASRAQQLRVAAASDLQFALNDLSARYETKTKQSLAISYGSSGNLFTQIENGAPFDLFFSADIGYPLKLIDTGLAERESFYSYALGRIVLWTLPESNLNLPRKGFSALLDPKVKKIAIANPEHAPYGKAAVASLQRAGIYDQVKAKLVFGENISQTAQFVQSGNAQVGIVALSLAISPAMQKGDRWLIPAEFHSPLEQGAVVISSSKNKEVAFSFLEFVKSSEGSAILATYGFTAAQLQSEEKRP